MSATILVVDDETSVLSLLKRLLESKGYAVVAAKSAKEGLQADRVNQIDVAITDLKMPDHDGLWLAQQLLKANRIRPVILITAYADLGSAQRAISLGIYAYFTKPLDFHQMINAIERAVEFRRMAIENQMYQQRLEEKVAERTRELERVYRELIHSEKLMEVGRLSAGIVHEVLNPLAVVMGRIEMLLMKDSELNESQKKSLIIARDQLKRAVKIMDNLRNFSRQRPSQRSEVDLNTLLSHTLDLLSHDIKKNNVQIEKALVGLPFIEADADQLNQVFLNLIKNAVEAMPQGGTLQVVTRWLDDRNGVEVVLSDMGEGIPEENLARIFDLFFTTKKNGTGLGLGICRGIIEAHGGCIEVKSISGKGSTFIVFLPQNGKKKENAQ